MSQPISLFSNQLIRAADLTIVAGETVHAAVSPDIGNSTGTIYNSMRLVFEYSGLSPVQTTNFTVGAVIEAADANDKFSPIHYQFSPLNGFSEALVRELILQPNLDSFNAGIDDIVFPVDREVARISRQNGKLPATKLRACILLVDNDPGGSTPFVEVTVDAHGELYNV